MGGKALNGKRIKREAIPMMVSSFLDYNDMSHIPYYICGSYRRGCLDSGDIELILHINNPEVLFGVRQRISRIFGWTLTGEPKMRGLWGLWGEVQFDLFIADDLSLGAMLMHATGSRQFNIKMRAVAKNQGLKLNQYGLWRINDEPVVRGKDEKDIFDYLSMRYHDPEERNM